jgi:hypothetical protein
LVAAVLLRSLEAGVLPRQDHTLLLWQVEAAALRTSITPRLLLLLLLLLLLVILMTFYTLLNTNSLLLLLLLLLLL